jgi:hypothetical protein
MHANNMVVLAAALFKSISDFRLFSAIVLITVGTRELIFRNCYTNCLLSNGMAAICDTIHS